MKFNKLADLFLNVLLPLLTGTMIYFLSNTFSINPVIRNYLPDALWAWSFISLLLIIWNRRLPVLWVIIAYLFAALFEYLQYKGWVWGTGDSMDVITYFIFFTIVLLINPLLKDYYFKKRLL